MLDFGWQEFMVIAVVTILVVGPKELPRVFRTVTGLMRKARSLAGEFHSAMDEMARDADLQDIKKEVTKVKNGSSDWVKEIDPTGEVAGSMKDAKGQVGSVKDHINKSARPNFPKPAPSKVDEPAPVDSTPKSPAPEDSLPDSPSPTTPRPVVTPKEESPKPEPEKSPADTTAAKPKTDDPA